MKDRDELDYDGEHYMPDRPSKHASVVPGLFPFILLILGALLLVAIARSCSGGVVTDPFLDAIERIESHGCATALGDHGRARGPFQLWAAAWEDVNRQRIASGHPPAAYCSGSTNRAVARSYARDYLLLLESRLARCLHRPPTLCELYAAYNCGHSRFERLGFSLRRVPATTRRNIGRLHALLGGHLNGDREPRQGQCCGVLLTASGSSTPN